LCEIKSGSLTKSYIYSNNGQILCQRNGGQSAAEYFYVSDRLGSVRQMIDSTGDVLRNYTYGPFGQSLESGKAGSPPSNPFMFTGQWFDSEIAQYYLRARMYDPQLMRFTARDPVRGKFKHPMSLHKYLYCLNNPISHTDPTGEATTTDVLYTNSQRAVLMGRHKRHRIDFPPIDVPYNHPHNPKRIGDELPNKVPKGPWNKFWYYLGKILGQLGIGEDPPGPPPGYG
jgi:RHS repeat-associated protein